MQSAIHDLLDQVVPRPLFFVLARFSNFIYRVFLGLYNDPTSWRSTLLPPLIALVVFYITLLTVYRTVQSTIRLIWWSIKWGAIAGCLLAAYAWWTGEADAINSTGQPPPGGMLDFGSLLGRAARDIPVTQGALANVAVWFPLLASQLPAARNSDRRASSRRRDQRRRAGNEELEHTIVGQLGERINDFVREIGPQAAGNADATGRGASELLGALLRAVGLDALTGSASSSSQRTPRRSRPRQRPARRQRSSTVRSSSDDEDDDYVNPNMPHAYATESDEEDDIIQDGPSTRTRSQSRAAAEAARRRARERRQRQAANARRSRTSSRQGAFGTRGGAADVDYTRNEIARAIQEFVGDLLG